MFQYPGLRNALRLVMFAGNGPTSVPPEISVNPPAPGNCGLRSMKLKRFGSPEGAGLLGPLKANPDATCCMRMQMVIPLLQSYTENGVPVLALAMPVIVQPPSTCLPTPCIFSPSGRFQLKLLTNL